jgi:3'(2'), 5'-bisphosphate nucleotidase
MHNNPSYEKELQAALEAVSEAAILCRNVQAGIGDNVIEKQDRSPVTLADFGSQALVCRALYENFPGVSIIAEEDATVLQGPDSSELLHRLVECVNVVRPYTDAHDLLSWIGWGSASHNTSHFWTIDPIDGTKGFLRGDQYAIALGLIVNGQLTAAVLGCPRLSHKSDGTGEEGVIFGAIRGQGAFQLPLDLSGTRLPVSVSDTADTTQIRFCESVEAAHSSHSDSERIAQKLGIVAESVRIDSQCKYAVVSRGQADAYLRLPKDADYREKIWDHAAGALIVSEAGGKVTDIAGKPLDFTHGKALDQNRGVIVSNGKVHDQIIETIEALGISQ